MSSATNLGEVSARFSRIYDESEWGRGSGSGSYPYFTIEYRAFLEKFLRMNSIKSVVDLGCGDWQSTRFLDLDDMLYMGFEVVESVIERNNASFGSETKRFSMVPADLTAIPRADVLIMKDVLQHLPDHEILRYASLVFPRYRFCLITNSYEKNLVRKNVDIDYGDHRTLDLTAPPYNLDGAYVLEYWALPWERIRTLLIHNRTPRQGG
jgi:hypothetical protein